MAKKKNPSGNEKPRQPRLDPSSPNYVPRMLQRYDITSSDPELRRLQQQIYNTTFAINNQEEIARADMIRSLELARDSTTDESLRVNLDIAIDRYRTNHVDAGVSLKDLSAKVRNVSEAQDILARLDNQTMSARDRRMRENYDRALRSKGMTNLANWLLGLSDSDFKLAYYAQANAEQGFLYKTIVEDMDALDYNWRKTARALGIKYDRALRERNSMEYVAEDFMDSINDSAARIKLIISKPKKSAGPSTSRSPLSHKSPTSPKTKKPSSLSEKAPTSLGIRSLLRISQKGTSSPASSSTKPKRNRNRNKQGEKRHKD